MIFSSFSFALPKTVISPIEKPSSFKRGKEKKSVPDSGEAFALREMTLFLAEHFQKEATASWWKKLHSLYKYVLFFKDEFPSLLVQYFQPNHNVHGAKLLFFAKASLHDVINREPACSIAY